MLAQLRLGIPSQQVIIFIVPHQCQRTDDIVCTRLAVTPLFGDGVFKVVEADLPIPGNGVGDLVHIIIHTLIHALDAAADIDLPLQELRIIDTGKALDFLMSAKVFLCVMNFDDCTLSTSSLSSGTSNVREPT